MSDSKHDFGSAGRIPQSTREAVANAELPKMRLPPKVRREMLIGEATRLFGEHGFDGVSIDTIAGAANVTKPIVYRHFESKEALYLAILDQHRQELPNFTAGVAADKPLAELVEGILDGWFAYAEENGARWRMIFRDSGGGPEIQDSRQRMYADARAPLIAFLKMHPAFDVPDEDLESTAEVIRGGLSSLVLFGQESPHVSRDSLVRSGTRMVVGLATR
jgi:AcrR family transcriptional regulator